MGLDREMFKDKVADEFICGLCSQVLLNPVTAGCEHRYCQSCITRKIKSRVTKPICPACNAHLSLHMEDTTVEFKLNLLNLTIQCSHLCGESFVLAELPDHMDTCPNAPVDCDFKSKGCKRTIKRCDRRKHLEECDFRIVECEACGYQTIYKELFTHQSRVRCLEKKLKQQIIRERKATSREINRHREKLFRDNVRLDQHQRKKFITHAKSLTSMTTARKHARNSGKEDADSEFDFPTQEIAFLTENNVQQHSLHTSDTDERERMELARHESGATKTPHSSRSGFAMQMCMQCNRKFKPDMNQASACRWHIGIQVFTCFACGRLDYQPGCATGFHRI